ncbi:hypothetical protein [Nostoc sp.]|uniref:hypothetical protein n=1 Tax=Nostoc sp. TaxID=1180 RepID=UPI002FFB3999
MSFVIGHWSLVIGHSISYSSPSPSSPSSPPLPTPQKAEIKIMSLAQCFVTMRTDEDA